MSLNPPKGYEKRGSQQIPRNVRAVEGRYKHIQLSRDPERVEDPPPSNVARIIVRRAS